MIITSICSGCFIVVGTSLGHAKLAHDRVKVVGNAIGCEKDDIAGLNVGHAACQVAKFGVDSVHRAESA